MTADLTPEDVAAIMAAEEAAERRAEAEEREADEAPSPLSHPQPADLVWPITPEDKAIHAAIVAAHLAKRRAREEAEDDA